MTLKEFFDFVVDPNLLDDDVDRYLEKLQETTAGRTLEDLESLDKQSEEHVFLNSYLPKRLDEVVDFERDQDNVQDGDEKLIYGTITALKPDLSGPAIKAVLLEDEDSNDSNEDDREEENETSKYVNSRRPKNETLEEKKARKNAVKEEQRLKRKDKVPKHVKKRREKVRK